jgi:hypothetical protein
MIQVVDIVNFNADASCLPASNWLRALEGGSGSSICRWLGVYVEERRAVAIGFTGATVADIAVLNPEAIALVNDHPEVFEVVLRPFSHDIALLRSPAGFALNVRAGRAAIERAFRHVTPYFLPAEFMLTNAQVNHLERTGIRGTFVNASRYKEELRSRIPERPYFVRGTFSSRLRCIPIQGELSEAYFQALHLWDAGPWNHAVAAVPHEVAFSWRDGESFLFVPDGIERERAWLQDESPDVQRMSLAAVEPGLDFQEPGDEVAAPCRAYRSYPVHSFSDWVKEFRMFGYMERLAAVEKRLESFDHDARALWLQAINSDVFSAVEKDSPVIDLRTAPQGDPTSREIRWTIQRTERGCEGEEFLEMLDPYEPAANARHIQAEPSPPHIRKLRARQQYLNDVLA